MHWLIINFIMVGLLESVLGRGFKNATSYHNFWLLKAADINLQIHYYQFKVIKLVKKLLKGHQDLQEKVHFSYFQIIIIFDPFAPNTPFLYPLKISFQRVEKGCIGNKFVNQKYVLAGLSLPKRLIGVILWYTFSRTNNFYLFIAL